MTQYIICYQPEKLTDIFNTLGSLKATISSNLEEVKILLVKYSGDISDLRMIPGITSVEEDESVFISSDKNRR